MFQRKKSHGKAYRKIGRCCLEECGDFLHTLKWNTAARKTAGRRIKIWESMARTKEDDDDDDDYNMNKKEDEGRGGRKAVSIY